MRFDQGRRIHQIVGRDTESALQLDLGCPVILVFHVDASEPIERIAIIGIAIEGLLQSARRRLEVPIFERFNRLCRQLLRFDDADLASDCRHSNR